MSGHSWLSGYRANLGCRATLGFLVNLGCRASFGFLVNLGCRATLGCRVNFGFRSNLRYRRVLAVWSILDVGCVVSVWPLLAFGQVAAGGLLFCPKTAVLASEQSHAAANKGSKQYRQRLETARLNCLTAPCERAKIGTGHEQGCVCVCVFSVQRPAAA